MKLFLRILLLSLFMVVAASILRADMPLPPPSRVIETSLNGRIRVVSDPKTGTRVEDVKQGKVLWETPEWHRAWFVADDGKHVVAEYDGLNLIPTNYTDDLVLFTFWSGGKKIREIRLKDFVPDRKILQQTISHFYWGLVEGFDARGRLKVKRADGKIFLFNVASGQIARG